MRIAFAFSGRENLQGLSCPVEPGKRKDQGLLSNELRRPKPSAFEVMEELGYWFAELIELAMKDSQ